MGAGSCGVEGTGGLKGTVGPGLYPRFQLAQGSGRVTLSTQWAAPWGGCSQKITQHSCHRLPGLSPALGTPVEPSGSAVAGVTPACCPGWVTLWWCHSGWVAQPCASPGVRALCQPWGPSPVPTLVTTGTELCLLAMGVTKGGQCHPCHSTRATQ